MRHLTVQWGLFFCYDFSPGPWSSITTLPLRFFWCCIKSCEFTEYSASEMSRPQKKHCKYPHASLCLSYKWFRLNSGVPWPDFVLLQWVICMTLAARLGTPGEPGQRQLCSVACPFWADFSTQGQQQVWGVKVWGSQPKREHYSRGFIAQPAGVHLSSSATHSYLGGQSLQNDPV